MADVRLLLIPTVVGLLALQRATFVFPTGWKQPLFALAAVAVLLFGRRAAWALVAAIAITMVETLHNHLLFGFWTIATWWLFEDLRQRRFVHRTQLSILYGFAGLSKLTTRWLSGAGMLAVLDLVGDRSPFPTSLAQEAAIAAAAVELALAVGVWLPRARPLVLLLGAGLHLGLMLLYGTYEQPLVFYNGLALLWLWDSTRTDALDREPVRAEPGVPSG